MKTLDESGENSTAKRRKTCVEDVGGECVVNAESKDSSKNSESTTTSSNFLMIMNSILLGFLSTSS